MATGTNHIVNSSGKGANAFSKSFHGLRRTTDGKFYTKKADGTVKEMGGAGSVTLANVVTNGNSTTTSILLDQGANLIFEGNLANAYETTLTVTEPTADRTITLPNATGTVALDGDALAYSIVFGG